MIESIQNAQSLQGKTVLVRASLNVPVENGVLVDDFRVRKMMPLLDFLRRNGARVILIGHRKGRESLRPVFEHMKASVPLTFIDGPFSLSCKSEIEAMSDGDVVMLENIRLSPGEEANDPTFAKDVSSLADIYVNEAFSVSHRKHASIVGIPRFIKSYMGIQFQAEIENLSRALTPERPFLLILGGAKFETKIPLAKKFLDIADTVCVSGALVNDIFWQLYGTVGNSLVSGKDLGVSEMLSHENLMLPSDVEVKNESGGSFVKRPQDVQYGERIQDVGKQSIEDLKSVVDKAKFILWNGPFGNYEEGFRGRTEDLARYVAECDAVTIIGGGDTLASIVRLKLEDRFSFVSTAGGAMVQFLLNGTLPGIEALKASSL